MNSVKFKLFTITMEHSFYMIMITLIPLTLQATAPVFLGNAANPEIQNGGGLANQDGGARSVGNLVQTSHDVGGEVSILDEDTLVINRFSYDNRGLAVYIMIATQVRARTYREC